MAPLTDSRNTQEMAPSQERVGLLTSLQTIHAGAILMRNSVGHLAAGVALPGYYGVGRAEETNVSGASGGVVKQRYREGIFRFANSAAADEITIADIGAACFIVDDQAVAKTDGTATRSPAGAVVDVDALGVWVRFDEALTRAILS